MPANNKIKLADTAGIVARTTLVPLEGAGSKVFPPTFHRDNPDESPYVLVVRTNEDGQETTDVMLDSTASQANRLEEELMLMLDEETIYFPNSKIDFTQCRDSNLANIGCLRDLDQSHRIFDAYFRDSELNGMPFRETPEGKAVIVSKRSDATGLMRHSLVTLLFGGWDSAKGAEYPGTKFERLITASLYGHNAQMGKAVASKMDKLPMRKSKKGDELYKHRDPAKVWTRDPSEALNNSSGKPVKFDGPSELNFGNVVPTVQEGRGGVYISEATQTAAANLTVVRNTKFGSDDKVNQAGQQVLVDALVLILVSCLNRDLALRSGCHLVPLPEKPGYLELVSRSGKRKNLEIDMEEAIANFNASVAAAEKAGLILPDKSGDLVLTPSDKLQDLILSKIKNNIPDTTEG